MMECNSKQIKQNVGSHIFQLPFSKSIELVLSASQEYFNSSANAADPSMSLARGCLNLIENVTSSIEEELDLISAMSLLQDFNINLLPLQVRLCENRMSIVEEVLQKKPKHYKRSQKVMRLGYLLRAGNGTTQDRDGKVLSLIGDYAFQAKDYDECFVSCNKLMETGYKDGWEICYKLGKCSDFDNTNARYSLMSFALAHCTEDLIEAVLNSKSELHLKVLQERVKFLVGDTSFYSSSDDVITTLNDEIGNSVSKNTLNTFRQASEKTAQVLHNTTHTAKAVFTKSTQFWKEAVNWIPTASHVWNSESSDFEETMNTNLDLLGMPAFYDGLVDHSHASLLEANYQRYARPDMNQSQEIASSIMRASLLQDSLKLESSNSSLNSSVLLDIAQMYLPEDIVYSFWVLLALEQGENAETLLSSVPSSPIVLQIASLFYAANIYKSLGFSSSKFTSDFDVDPTSFIQTVLDLENSSSVPDAVAGRLKRDDVQSYYRFLQRYHKKLYDFVQAQILHSIGGGVDATRFANDDVYKKDTILGTSLTLDDKVLQIAVSLANQYNVPVWDIYMTHLEYLFAEPSVPGSVITQRMEQFKLNEKLLKNKKTFEKRLRECIYPGISGKDYDKLLICFSLLEDCGNNADHFKITPVVHKKLLMKFKAAVNNIDYKSVMSPELSVSYLKNILNESNVHIFAKAAENIPKEGDGFYESSYIYCLFSQKFFFEGNTLNSKLPTTKTEWLHRYENCSDMLQRLNPIDVVKFIDGVVFSDQFISIDDELKGMTIDCRSEIVKRAMKFCRARSAKHKNNIVLSNEWNDASSTLTSYYSHLQRLEESTLAELRASSDPKVKEYCKDFDLSKSIVDKLRDLLTRIIIEGPDLDLLKTFMSFCPAEIEWEPSDAYIKAINTVLEMLRNPENSDISSLLKSLEAILEDIYKESEELFIEDIATEILNEFCRNPESSVSAKIHILHLLEKSNCLPTDQCDLLLLYRTQAIVSATWPDLEVSEEEVKDEFQRTILFDSLLSLCKEVDHFHALSKILSHWPPFSKSDTWTCHSEPWVKLLSKLLSQPCNDSISAAVDMFDRALLMPTFDEECCRDIFVKIKSRGSIMNTMKYALKTHYSVLHLEALIELKDSIQVKEEYDNELVELILKHKLTSQIVSTYLYKPVIEYLLHCQDDNVKDTYKCLDNVIKELYEAGLEPEAGSLLLIRNSTHPSLSTFSSALSMLHRWISTSQ